MNSFRKLPQEEFKEIILPVPQVMRYAVSNKGRLLSFTNEMSDGKIIKGAKADGYRLITYKNKEGEKVKRKSIVLYKLIAELFLEKPSEQHTHVIHLDRRKDNDDIRNLKWVTRPEMLKHSYDTNPVVLLNRKKLLEHNLKSDGRKLTVTKVMLIKKILARPNQKTRLKMIAKQFGVSEMQIRRIKSGENWGYVKV
ncbi:NUMOD4 domain-containing protein [Flavobacterium sp. SM15]|uniref:NUMOD4 domain-containing protein n=1 Tax=Flavobacterium sp. SM15 TaxID=2908005 RepID=UPI001EDC7232|nr:NUMOD4 domain-containing protein [Flavobacterium sp. SM15]MCG2611083.1 NUMOD4 domain-containing protein [Flavobacterium sp. SM15]